MKKILSLILALAMVLALAACGNKPAEDAGETQDPTVTQPGDITENPEVSDDISTTDEPTETPQSGSGTVTPTVKPTTPTPKPSAPAADSNAAKTVDELKTYMSSVVSGIDEVMMPSTDEVPQDSYKSLLGIDYVKGYNAVTYMPMVGSVAFEVALISVPSGTDAATVAASIEAGVDPARWICVCADTVDTAVNGNVILLYMLDSTNYPDTAATLTANFGALAV